VQPEAAGMADAVRQARSALQSFGQGPLYVTQAQDIVDPSLHPRMLGADLGQDFGLLAASRVRSYFPGGYLTVVDGRIASIIEKTGLGREPSDLVNIVAPLFVSWQPLLDQIELERMRPGPDDAYERALGGLM